MIGIYKITSPSKKVYVGQSIDIKDRWTKYNSLNCGNQTKLKNSLEKYGVDAHKFEILEECDETLLNKRERYWQEYYDVLNSGLNCRLTESTDKSGRLSEQTKIKIGDANRGRVHSEKSKLNMSKPKSDSSKMGRYDKSGKNNPFYGRTHSEETKQKIREATKNQVFTEETYKKISEANKKPILQFTKEGEFVAEYPSRNDAAKAVGIGGGTISAHIGGYKKSAGGFIWKYK
jgi:group I intron endonuclease